MPSRRAFLGSVAATAALGWGTPAQARPVLDLQLQLSLQMAKAYALQGDNAGFRRLFQVQAGFLGLRWPTTPLIVTSAVDTLRRVLDGESVGRKGFQHVLRQPMRRTVVFSDHHILPDAHRQSALWRANRGAYARLLDHYGGDGWLVVENGDAEDLVILEPDVTEAMYRSLIGGKGQWRNPKRLMQWYREDPRGMVAALEEARLSNRQRQLDVILSEPGNQEYYRQLEQLAARGQLIRLAGNHDHNLQDLVVGADHLVPSDILLLGNERTEYVIMHGHQFDQATNPGVASLYGEVVSECLGVWYQGPDRVWSWKQVQRFLEGGFPNRLSSHQGSALHGGQPASLVAAILTPDARDDERWSEAWESLFGHPIAWEYGARDWSAAVLGYLSHPGDLVDDAMLGRQFFKFRHLDEWEIVRALNSWQIKAALVLGHSHEVRAHGTDIRQNRYFNSGSVGRYERLIWALELFDSHSAQIVGWFVQDNGVCERVEFQRRESELVSYFMPDLAKPLVRVGRAP